MKTVSLTLLAILLLLPSISMAQETSTTLIVQIITPDGKPKQGIVVSAEGPNYREAAVTNASGYAVFRQLSPGTYDLVVSLQNIELVRRSISFPENSSLVLEAPLSRLSVRVVDLSGRSVNNIFVTLTSPSGIVSTSQRTNATGYAVFSDIPYSSVARVGGVYDVKVTKDMVLVGAGKIDVKDPLIVYEIRASLVNVEFSVVNLDGQTVNLEGSLSLTATNISQTITVTGGKASAPHLPSSSVVGQYNTSLSMKLGAQSVTVYSSFLSLETDANFTIPAEVGELTLKVVDPDNLPVKNVGILVGTTSAGNFTSGTSGDDGTFSAGLLPLSSKVGEYTLSIFRGRKRIQAEKIILETSKALREIKISFQHISFTVTDYGGKPLDGAVITVIDPQTGRRVNSTTANGEGAANVFPGANQLIILYDGKEVYNQMVEISGNRMDIRLTSVNFPVVVRILDGFGRFVEGLRFSLRVDNAEKANGLTKNEPITVILKLPSEVVVDVYEGNKLLSRERIYAEGPSHLDIRFTGKVSIGGSLVDVQTVVSAVLAAVFALLIVALVYRVRVLRQR